MTTTKEQPKPEEEQKKLPYTKPELVVLGSVRELTGSGVGSTTEGLGFPFPASPP